MASLLERVEEVQSVCFMIGLWRVTCDRNWVNGGPSITKGAKLTCALLAGIIEGERRQRSVLSDLQGS